MYPLRTKCGKERGWKKRWRESTVHIVNDRRHSFKTRFRRDAERRTVSAVTTETSSLLSGILPGANCFYRRTTPRYRFARPSVSRVPP